MSNRQEPTIFRELTPVEIDQVAGGWLSLLGGAVAGGMGGYGTAKGLGYKSPVTVVAWTAAGAASGAAASSGK